MSKRDELRQKRRQREQRQKLITYGIIAAVAVIVVVVLILVNQGTTQVQSFTPIDRPNVKDNSMGDPNAPVKVVEYSDFQCPYCRRFTEEQEANIIAKYITPGKVYFTYTPFSFIGQESVVAAEAAYCAMDQGKFWEYHDILFANQNGENVGTFTQSKLINFAKVLNLNTSEFQTCLTSQKYSALVNQDIQNGKNVGVQATPMFWVNGQLVQSNELESAIDTALQGK